MNLKEVETILKNILKDAKIQSFETVYEMSKDKKFYKLVNSFHNLDFLSDDDYNTNIIHTKLIFKTNLKKEKLIDNSFLYLRDIDCSYIKVDFEDADDLDYQIREIFTENDFGEYIKILSEFISNAPASSINDFFNKTEITDITVTNVKYSPVTKMMPCEDTTFDFDFNINNGEYEIRLSIDKNEKFTFYYYLLDNVEDMEITELEQLPQLIGDHLSLLHNKYMK